MIRRNIKWSLLSVAAFILLTIIAVELISWNLLKPRIKTAVEQATGRELFIEGDVELSLLPRPQMTLHEVALANPDWAGPEHFIELDRLRVAPDLLALVTGQVALARVDIDNPEVRLVDRTQGPANWVLSGSSESQPADSSENQSDADPLPFHRVNVDDAEIRYRPTGSGEPLKMRMPSLQLLDDGEIADLDARLVVRDRDLKIRAQSDSLFSWGAGAETFEGDLDIRSPESRIESRFTLKKPVFPAEWQLWVDADIANVDRWLDLVPGFPATTIGPFAIEARVARQGSVWTADELLVNAMDSNIKADLEMETQGDVPALSGSVRSSMIDVAALREALPSNQDSAPKGAPLPLPWILPTYSGSIDVAVQQIVGLARPISSARAGLHFGPHRVSIENAELEAGDFSVTGSAAVTSSPDAVSASLALSGETLNEDDNDASLPSLAADFDIQLNPVARENWRFGAIARAVELPEASFDYSDPQADTELSATAQLVGDDPQPVVDLNGTLKGRPLNAKIEGAPVAGDWPGSGYGLDGEATSNGLVLSAETKLDSILNTERLAGRVSLSGDDVEALGPWVGRDLMTTPPFEVVVRVDRDADLWRGEALQVEIGQSSLRGDLQVDTSGKPRISATLQADPLDLAWLRSEPANRESQSDAESSDAPRAAGAGQSDLAWLRAFDADVELASTRVEIPEAPALHEVDLKAELEDGTLVVQQLRAGVADGSVSVSGQLQAQQMPASARIDTRFEDIALGRLADSFTPLEERLGRMSGRIRAVATQSLDEAFRDDVLAPMLGRLKLEPSELRFTDVPADTDVQLSFRTEDLASGDQHFTIDGSGRYDGAPFSLDFRSDALLGIRLPDRPYSLEMDATVVGTRIELSGSLMRPLALEGLDLQLDLNGPNPQRLSRLLGVPLPDLPAYDVSGQLGLTENSWSLSNLDGTVGDSDLSGRLAFDSTQSPPFLSGELTSDTLHLQDLARVVGAEPSGTGGETADSSQQREAPEEAESQFILPQGIVLGDAWRRVEADVRYRGASVRAAGVPLSDVVINFRMVDGVARLEPVGFGVGNGEVDFSLELDAKQDPSQGTLTVEVRSVDLREALKDWGLADGIVGIVGAQGKFWVTGDSIAALLGSADGGMVMLMTEGQLEAILVELAGLDAGQAFLSWLGGRDAIPINCAYVDLQARDGRVELDTFVIDTPDTIFTAGGRVDLENERLDVSIVAHPQDASALVGRTPFHLGGTFSNVEAGIHGGELALRLGASAGLAALVGPLAAALPLLERGGDDRLGYCQGLTRRTNQAIKNDEDES